MIVQVLRPLAQRCASIMFSLEETAPTLADMQDALGEITNMTSGHLKSLMSGNCYLPLPAVVEGSDDSIRIPTAQVLARAIFDCEGMQGVVSLVAAGA